MTDLDAASRRAQRLYPRHRGLRSVYLRGAAAALAGRSVDVCPYRPDANKTWRTAWRNAWLGGYRSISSLAEH